VTDFRGSPGVQSEHERHTQGGNREKESAHAGAVGFGPELLDGGVYAHEVSQLAECGTSLFAESFRVRENCVGREVVDSGGTAIPGCALALLSPVFIVCS
jgi:hypothetical protein